jgi:hypothetical protein
MLGYVQSDPPDRWANAIQQKLRREPKQKHRLTGDGDWTAIRLIPALEHTYTTRHSRPTLSNITIYHTLLDLRFPRSREEGPAGLRVPDQERNKQPC